MKDAPFEIWVGNLAAYTEGKTMGKWITLPEKNEELDTTIAQISRDGKDEIMIMDYDFREDCLYLKDMVGEWSNISELNVIAKLIGEEEHPKVEAYVSAHGTMTLSELANLLLQEEKIPFYPYEFEGIEKSRESLSNEEKMGYTMLERDSAWMKQLAEMQVNGLGIWTYLDVNAIGRDSSLNGDVDLYDNGYLDMRAEGPDLAYYKMQEIKENLAEEEKQDVERQQAERQNAEKKEEMKEKKVKENPPIAPSI